MKLLVSHESPIELFEESVEYNDYQYALVHLLDTNKKYRDWFLNDIKIVHKAEIMLDNSVFELKEAFDSAKYAGWIERLRPNSFIVPDVLENGYKTIERYIEFINEYKDVYKYANRIGVVQGSTWSELVDCYQFMSRTTDYIAISFDYSYYEVTGIGEDKLSRWCSGRQRFVQQLIAEGIWNWNKPHHLLGCSLAREFKFYVTNNIHNIRSVDTSNPIVAALKGLRYNEDQGLKEKPSTLLADLIDAKVDDDIRLDVIYNTQQFKRIIGR